MSEYQQPVTDAGSPAVTKKSGGLVWSPRSWMAQLRQASEIDAVWFGVIALALAIHGQRIMTPGERPVIGADVGAAARWYALAVAVLVLGWWGTYVNRSLVHPVADVRQRWWVRPSTARIATVSAALLANLMSILILRGNWYSLPGGLLWVASLALLVLACAREPVVPAGSVGARRDAPSPPAGATPLSPELQYSWTLPRRFEIALFLAIMTLALVMRLWRLGDLTPGMHGDEGEAGADALDILNGDHVSPFMRGWFNQSNVYYWSLALTMRVFGSGLFGLRMFTVLCGLLTVLFVYLLAREMFGQRAAIMAGFFMAFQSAALLFSRQEFSNGTTPPLMAMTVYFMVRGFRTRRHLDFVLSGFAAGWALYYFAGGRLVVLIALAFLAFLAVRYRFFLATYWTRAAAFVMAFCAISSPFIAYFVAYPILGMQYPNDRFIWLHHLDLAGQYGSYDWKVILWGQLTRTVSIITYAGDISAMGALDYPIARPLEAALIVLGLAWAAWRWRDSRFALLSIWFWSWIVVGGVLTIDAPNLPRIVGVLPVLPLAMAAVLDHLAGQIVATTTRLGEEEQKYRTIPWRRVGQGLAVLVAGSAVAFSGVQNWQMYIGYYLNTHQNPVVTGQAAYVQHKGPSYRFYGMGAHLIYWTHGDNRFINPHADGVDAANASNFLPIVDNGSGGEKNAAFLLWPTMYDYLHVLQAYYPEGKKEVVQLGDPEHRTDPLIGYLVTHEQIDRHRMLRAQYTPVSGRSVQRGEPDIGLAGHASPPVGLHYPVRARWDGALVAPRYDRYRFHLKAPPGARLTIDGVSVLHVGRVGNADAALDLAQGPHSVNLSGTLHSAATRIDLRWASSLGALKPIARKYLWDDHVGRSWLGEIRILPAQPAGSSSSLGLLTIRRVDGFLGFRNSGWAFYPGSQLSAHWGARLTVTRPGLYGFQLNSNGASTLLVDGKVVVNDTLGQLTGNGQPQTASGSVQLSPGSHTVEVRYSWLGGFGFLECWWTPPGSARQLFITPDLHLPAPAVWPAAAAPPTQPPPVPQFPMLPRP